MSDSRIEPGSTTVGSASALALALASALAMGAAEPARHVCHVEDVDGPAGAVAVERGEEAVPLMAYSPLYEGDRIVVLDPAGSVILRCGKEEIEIGGEQDPYEVAAVASSPSRAANLMSWLSGFLLGRTQYESTAELAVRAGRPALPLLEAGPVTVAAGRSRLHVAWEAGRPPFLVRLLAGAGRRELARRTADERHAVLELDRPLAPGDYRLEVVDSNHATGRARFSAVEPAALPQPPAEVAPTADDDAVGRTLEAAWLASVEDGRWALEAHQRAAELAPEHPGARRLRNALAAGHRPDPLR